MAIKTRSGFRPKRVKRGIGVYANYNSNGQLTSYTSKHGNTTVTRNHNMETTRTTERGAGGWQTVTTNKWGSKEPKRAAKRKKSENVSFGTIVITAVTLPFALCVIGLLAKWAAG